MEGGGLDDAVVGRWDDLGEVRRHKRSTSSSQRKRLATTRLQNL